MARYLCLLNSDKNNERKQLFLTEDKLLKNEEGREEKKEREKTRKLKLVRLSLHGSEFLLQDKELD